MSVNIGQLNKAGLAKRAFGVNKKTTGVSTQAAKNLTNSSSASKSTVFSFGQSRGANWVGGQHINRDKSKYNYQGMRAQANSRTYTPQRSGSATSVGRNTVNYQVDNGSAYMKGVAIGQTISAGISLLNQLGVFDKLKGDNSTLSNSDKLTQAMEAMTGSSGAPTEVSGLISKMDSCSDSGSLRGAIAEANGQLYSMNGMSGIIQADADKATQGMAQFESNYDNAKSAEKTAKDQLGQANKNLEGAKVGRDNALNEVSKADSQYGEATRVYTQAHDAHVEAKTNHTSAQAATQRADASLKSAESTLASTDKYLTDSNGNKVENPAYAQAERAVEQAKKDLQQAKDAEQAAKEKMDAAAEAETKAADDKKVAYESLGDKKAAVDTAEKKLKQQQGFVDTAKTNQGKATDNLAAAQEKRITAKNLVDSAEGAIYKLQTHTKNVSKLKEAISKQTKRLGELEQKEQKNYDKYDGKAQKGIDKNNARQQTIVGDVDTRAERRTVGKMDKTNSSVQSNLNKRDQYADNVSDSQWIKNTLMKQPANVIVGGEQYRTGKTPSGQTVYYRGNMPISEEEYKNVAGKAGL